MDCDDLAILADILPGMKWQAPEAASGTPGRIRSWDRWWPPRKLVNGQLPAAEA